MSRGLTNVRAPAPPRFLGKTPLADGADQIGAELALELGFELHAVLPFTRERTRPIFPPMRMFAQSIRQAAGTNGMPP